MLRVKSYPIKEASRQGQLPQGKPEQLIEAKVTAGVLIAEEGETMREGAIARNAAIQVDSFVMTEVSRAALSGWPSEQPLYARRQFEK
ncbi:acyl-CoA dehydrogenase domain-containing protein [Altericista sp. CCNU0014]|uniref:acyl-CoA dehydrogenase domain-containing protein n=1 Tax=Altericista sp. CCNU0014 TaxID=3082949 RepID=UPI00384C625C